MESLSCMALVNCPLTARIVCLAAGGLSLDQIAKKLAVHRSSVYRRLRAAGVQRQWTPTTSAERARIRRLIAADHSRRAVASMTGRGLGTVARIAAAAYGLNGDALRGRVRRLQRPVRCPTCGAKIVELPCLVCRLRGC
jgi:transposase